MDPQHSDEPSAPLPAATYPGWILLDNDGCCDDHVDTRTVAHALTSRGRPVSVSFALAAPPAVSRLRLHSPGQLPEGVNIRSYAVAAHGDYVLVKFYTWFNYSYTDWVDYNDYFLYCAGDAHTSRPPSLSLLPHCYMSLHKISLLRRGQDEVVVAAMDFRVENHDDVLEAELCLFRSGGWEWERKRLPVIHDEGKREEVSCWKTHRVIPVGDSFVLWVDIYHGIIYSDLSQEAPELHYVSLPVEHDPLRSREHGRKPYRNVCGTKGGKVRFVAVSPRCCCGCPGTAACTVSRHAFTITVWALRMDDMTTWDIVSVVDCDELWSLPGYHDGVARIMPEYPTVSLEDPNVLCLMVNNKRYYDMDDVDSDRGTWLVELDTRRMELRSIRYYGKEELFAPYFIVSAVSQYFNASSHSGTPVTRIDTDVESPARTSKLIFPRAAPPEEMLATLQEIPELARDDMLKAYGVLAWDESQFKFRSLLALPTGMRKDYCLLIGNLSCFDV